MAILSGVELLLPDPPAWRAWLEEHHADTPAVWLVLTKKGGTLTALTWQTALDEALCFGWIDGQARRRSSGPRPRDGRCARRSSVTSGSSGHAE